MRDCSWVYKQLTTTDLHLAAYADVLEEHISPHASYSKQFFHLVFLSYMVTAHLTVYGRECWTRDFGHESIWRCSPEAGAYYTCEIIFSVSTSMENRSVYYTVLSAYCIQDFMVNTMSMLSCRVVLGCANSVKLM